MDSKNRQKIASNKFHSNGFKRSTKRKINSEGERKITNKNRNAKNFPSSRLGLNHANNGSEESRKIPPFKSALRKYHNIREEKLKLREQAQKKREETKIALNKYNQRKQHRNRKLLAKTSKGQPIMKNRVEILLEKIKSSMVYK